jgi:hypothetical protein
MPDVQSADAVGDPPANDFETGKRFDSPIRPLPIDALQ